MCASSLAMLLGNPPSGDLWHSCVRRLGPQLDNPEQHLVSLCGQLINGARSDLGVDAVDELLLDLWCQHRLSENLPPRCHGAGELLEKMLDATLAAAQRSMLPMIPQRRPGPQHNAVSTSAALTTPSATR